MTVAAENRGWGGPAIGFGLGFGPSYGYYGDSYAYYDEPYYSQPSGDDDAYCSQRYGFLRSGIGDISRL